MRWQHIHFAKCKSFFNQRTGFKRFSCIYILKNLAVGFVCCNYLPPTQVAQFLVKNCLFLVFSTITQYQSLGCVSSYCYEPTQLLQVSQTRQIAQSRFEKTSQLNVEILTLLYGVSRLNLSLDFPFRWVMHSQYIFNPLLIFLYFSFCLEKNNTRYKLV